MIVAPESRSSEQVESLYNAPFCAYALGRFAQSYNAASETRGGGAAPMALLFLCLPMTLHDPTRTEILRHKSNYSLHRIIVSRPDLLVGLPRRIQGMRRFTNAGILLGAEYGWLRVDTRAMTVIGRVIQAWLSRMDPEGDARNVIRSSDLLGTWMGRLRPHEVFLFLNVIME